MVDGLFYFNDKIYLLIKMMVGIKNPPYYYLWGEKTERERFELSIPFQVHTLSRRAPSTTRPPLRELCRLPGRWSWRLGRGVRV